VSTAKTIRQVTRTPEFERDPKKLRKRFGTLEDDLATFIDYEVELFHGQRLAVGRIERVAGLGFEDPPVFVAKRVACRALRGSGSNSGIRVVYAWFAAEGRIELVELYYKGDKQVEDKARIKRLYAR
jgi:hypothetical protein